MVTIIDHIHLRSNTAYIKILKQHGAENEEVLYSGVLDKITRLGRLQRRILAVTSRAIYILDSNMRRCRYRTELRTLGRILCSSTSFQIAICVPQEYDRVFISADAEALCRVLCAAFRRATGGALPVLAVAERDLRLVCRSKREGKRPGPQPAEGPPMTDSATRAAPVVAEEEPEVEKLSTDFAVQSRVRSRTVVHYSVSEEEVDLDSFDVLRVLGKGSFGKVYQVRKRSSGAIFAMKMLSKEAILQRRQLQHTLTERQILEAVQHPYLVRLHWAFQTDSKLYLVLDCLSGGELFFHLKKASRFPEERARFYAAQIVLAIGHLHSLGIVYRDLKPENILLDSQGHIRITDFGLAKQAIVDNYSASTFCGTPEYLAPEVLRGQGHGRAVDWWSLGTLLFEMLVGLPPFYERNVNAMYERILYEELTFPPIIGEPARDLLSKMLERNPEKRLGAGARDASEIMEHPFFHDLDWAALLDKRIPAPFTPVVKSEDDIGNFDTVFTDEPVTNPEQEKFVDTRAQRPVAMAQIDASLFDGFIYSPAQGLAVSASSLPSLCSSGSLSSTGSTSSDVSMNK